jgi:hypothetical protein
MYLLYAVQIGTLITIGVHVHLKILVERTDGCANTMAIADIEETSGWLAHNRDYALESTNKRRVLVEVGRGLMDDTRRVAAVGRVVFAMGTFALPHLRGATLEVIHNLHARAGDCMENSAMIVPTEHDVVNLEGW